MNQQEKQTALVICPGRGTYNKEELGYLQKYHADKKLMFNAIDAYRESQGFPGVQALDAAEEYVMKTHTAGEHASALIYACALGDFLSIDRNKFDIVAVTGNSMGWYIALAVAQALKQSSAIKVINTMGAMMQDKLIGGQMIYPLVDDNWQIMPERIKLVEQVMAEINLNEKAEVYTSIKLGGFIVFGANHVGMKMLTEKLPMLEDRYPMKLYNHAAFHTPLLHEISEKAVELLSADLFSKLDLPLIDGRGHIWQPYATDLFDLYDYTLGQQVYDTYDYSKAVQVAVKEFAPDKIIILGPGKTLGGATAQTLIDIQWRDLINKQAFINQQKNKPLILAMGIDEQRELVV